MHLKSLLTLLILAFANCQTTAQDFEMVDLSEVLKKQENKTSSVAPKMILDKNMSRFEQLFWQYYATKRLEFRKGKYPSVRGTLHPSFEEEVFARSKLVLDFKGVLSKFPEELRAYVNDLAAVVEAGFLKEYSWTFHRQKDWKQLKDIRLAEFEVWRKDHLADHTPRTRVELAMGAAPQARHVRILIDKRVVATPEEAAVWMRYALVRFHYLHTNKLRPNGRVNEVVIPSFNEELHGRSQIAKEIDKLLKIKLSKRTEAYLKDLAAIQKAGFIREYVWKHYRQPAWKQPDDLRLKEFAAWTTANLAGHEPIVGAALMGR